MKTLIKIALITVALTSITLFAGSVHSHDGGHGHSHSKVLASKSMIESTAKGELTRLVGNHKIEESWENSPVSDMKKKQFHHNTEWVVHFKNTSVKDSKKQTLYIFVNLYGKITGANFTGK